jgi:GTPase
VVLVGYTNAGKTSLMNALTDAQRSARDRAFETLDNCCW